jgi:hypothetical protein
MKKLLLAAAALLAVTAPAYATPPLPTLDEVQRLGIPCDTVNIEPTAGLLIGQLLDGTDTTRVSCYDGTSGAGLVYVGGRWTLWAHPWFWHKDPALLDGHVGISYQEWKLEHRSPKRTAPAPVVVGLVSKINRMCLASKSTTPIEKAACIHSIIDNREPCEHEGTCPDLNAERESAAAYANEAISKLIGGN